MQPSMNIEIHASGMLVRGRIRTTEGEESRRLYSQRLVIVDATIIIDSYSERSPHIYNIRSSELYALNKRG